MGRPALLSMLALLAAVLTLMSAPAALRAHDKGDDAVVSATVPSGPACHSASDLNRTFAEMRSRAAWQCPPADDPMAFSDGIRADLPAGWLRFDHSSWNEAAPPRYFFSRIARFEAISFAAIDADGTMRMARYLEDDGKPFASGPVFELPLPEITADTEALLVRIERPHSVPLLTEARLSVESESGEWSQFDVMLLPLVIGMLILPLFFDISFAVVLRERFVAIHAATVAAMIFYVLFAGGMISIVADLSVHTIAVIGPLSYALGCGLATLFLAEFLEPDAQSKFMRRLVKSLSVWIILVPGFCALQLHATQSFDDKLYFLSFVPVIPLTVYAIGEALWRGSRAAIFMAVAWTPIILASAERTMRGFGFYTASSQLDQLIYLAVAIEVIVLSLAIADRFLALRGERDAAVTEARMLEKLSSHDPLTGLMNRRAVESRFNELRAQGFDTFALIDLDMFKDINDRFGHQVGDSALIATASALSSEGDRDTIAVRLGGEEFVLLLRGPDSTRRADHLRQAIPRRIANEIPELDRLVTASMGVLELPRIAIGLMAFDELYSRADQLLYEAKAAGRNRMLYERLSIFEKPAQEIEPKTRKTSAA